MDKKIEAWYPHLSEERKKLEDDIGKLESFLRSKKGAGVKSDQKDLLRAQVMVMLSLSEILRLRLLQE